MPWLELDADNCKGTFVTAPKRADISDLVDIKEQMIIEYYSK
jgi:small subunit ribosomal protein S4